MFAYRLHCRNLNIDFFEQRIGRQFWERLQQFDFLQLFVFELAARAGRTDKQTVCETDGQPAIWDIKTSL